MRKQRAWTGHFIFLLNAFCNFGVSQILPNSAAMTRRRRMVIESYSCFSALKTTQSPWLVQVCWGFKPCACNRARRNFSVEAHKCIAHALKTCPESIRVILPDRQPAADTNEQDACRYDGLLAAPGRKRCARVKVPPSLAGMKTMATPRRSTAHFPISKRTTCVFHCV